MGLYFFVQYFSMHCSTNKLQAPSCLPASRDVDTGFVSPEKQENTRSLMIRDEMWRRKKRIRGIRHRLADLTLDAFPSLNPVPSHPNNCTLA